MPIWLSKQLAIQIIYQRMRERKEPLKDLFGGAVLDGGRGAGTEMRAARVNSRSDRARRIAVPLRCSSVQKSRPIEAKAKSGAGKAPDQEGSAALKPAEMVHELNGAAADPEDRFDQGAVDDGYQELLERA